MDLLFLYAAFASFSLVIVPETNSWGNGLVPLHRGQNATNRWNQAGGYIHAGGARVETADLIEGAVAAGGEKERHAAGDMRPGLGPQ